VADLPHAPLPADAAGVANALAGWIDADEIAALHAAGTLPRV
jgi:hypothetical protein